MIDFLYKLSGVFMAGNSWKSINWKDPFLLEQQLTDDQRLVRDTANQFGQEKLLPRVREAFRKEETDPNIFTEMGSLGLLGSTIHGYDCPGVDYMSYGLIAREIERVDSGYRSMMSVQSSLVMYPIHKFGSEEQKEKWLKDLGSGNKIGCFGLTEPNFGSNPGGMITSCKKDGDDWILNGNKMWITNGSIADVAVVWANDENNTIRGFLVEKGIEGFSSSDVHGKLSLRASITSELSFSDVRVPDSSRLPNIEGLKGPLSCLTQARYGIAWGMVGASIDCYNTALNYSKERKQFSKPIAAYQLTQLKLADMITDITEAQLLVYRLGRLKDEDKMTFQQVSLAKRNNCVIARDIARKCREILGGNGITIDYSPIRHMANIESVFTYEGTHEMHSLIVGEHETGIAAYDS